MMARRVQDVRPRHQRIIEPAPRDYWQQRARTQERRERVITACTVAVLIAAGIAYVVDAWSCL